MGESLNTQMDHFSDPWWKVDSMGGYLWPMTSSLVIEDRNRDPGRPIVPQCTLNVDHAPQPWISLAEFTGEMHRISSGAPIFRWRFSGDGFICTIFKVVIELTILNTILASYIQLFLLNPSINNPHLRNGLRHWLNPPEGLRHSKRWVECQAMWLQMEVS